MLTVFLVSAALLAAADPAGLGAVPAGSVRVYLVRHGEAHSNLTQLPSMPEKDMDALTEKGHRQVIAAGAALSAVDLSLVLYSPTNRTKETATAIVGSRRVPLREERALRRIDIGKTQTGKPLALTDRVAIWKAGSDARPADGESMADLGNRMFEFVKSLRKDHAGKGVVGATHAEPIAALLGHLKGTPGALRYPPGIPLASITVLDVNAAGEVKEMLAKFEPSTR